MTAVCVIGTDTSAHLQNGLILLQVVSLRPHARRLHLLVAGIASAW